MLFPFSLFGVLCLLLSMLGGQPSAMSSSAVRTSTGDSIAADSARVLQTLSAGACSDIDSTTNRTGAGFGFVRPRIIPVSSSRMPCVTAGSGAHVRVTPAVYQDEGTTLPDGTLIGRQRIAGDGHVALDVVSYASDGLVVGGLLCYPDDGQPHSTVIHIHGGLEGVFEHTNGDLVQTCIDWAALHGRTAFAPSLRGEDGGDGTPELCLGEADDVVAAATMLRGLDVTDPTRLAVVGGSVGGCVALRAAPRIPDLSAVVAFVPPVSWKDLVEYHRTQWSAATETLCDNTTRDWTIGGPSLADTFDSVICGHPGCSDADYLSRSPLPYVSVQTAPTLIVSAENDNIVPFNQQVLWSLMRQSLGRPVSVIAVNKCDPPATPPLAMDVHIVVPGAFHLLAPGPVSSGMLFLMAELDKPANSAPAAPGVR